MQLLLDTHSFLWFIAGSKRLSDTARDLIADVNNPVFLSVASLWEIAIKNSLGKLTLSRPFEVLIPEQLKHNEIEILHIELAHLATLAKLPLHHRDPFDHLIIAQAMTEGLSLVGRDTAFGSYPVTMIW